MENKNIPEDLKVYVAVIHKIFMERAKRDAANLSRDYFWKWTYTGDIAKGAGVTVEKARRDLTKLEKLGIIHANRRPNYISWAYIADGWGQHKYADYLSQILKQPINPSSRNRQVYNQTP